MKGKKVSNGPVLKLKSYPVTLTIFEKTNEKGYPYWTGKLEGKPWKDEQSGEWKHAPVYDNSFLQAAALFQEAYRILKVEKPIDRIDEVLHPDGTTWTPQDQNLDQQAKEAFS